MNKTRNSTRRQDTGKQVNGVSVSDRQLCGGPGPGYHEPHVATR